MTTGTRSVCAPPAATPSRSRTCNCRCRHFAAVSRSGTQSNTSRGIAAGLFHAAAAFGIAEVARATVAAGLVRRDELDPHSQMIAAENFVDLSACRAVLSSAGALIDEHHERNPTSRGTAQELTELFAEAQSAKVFIGEAAVRIVDRALALSEAPAT